MEAFASFVIVAGLVLIIVGQTVGWLILLLGLAAANPSDSMRERY